MQKLVSPLFSLLLCLFSWLAVPLWAQDASVYYEKKPEDVGMVSICVWSKVNLYAEPGQGAEIVSYVLFGEALQHLGEEALVRRERNNYLLVEAQDGARGWIDDQYVVRNAGLVVMLRNARVFNKPSTYSSSSGLQFYAGELVILSDWEDNWVYLTGEEGRVFGWVEGYERLSVEPEDIEVAGLLRKALMIADPNDQMIALRNIASMPDLAASPVRGIVEDILYQLGPQSQTRPEGGAMPDGSSPNQGFDPMPQDSSYVENTQVGEDGMPYVVARERGTVQPVKAQDPPSIYYAYHKVVPLGEKLLLQVPGREGQYVELQVIARLRPTNPHVVGLGPEVIKKVFGADRAKEIGPVSIVYIKPE